MAQPIRACLPRAEPCLYCSVCLLHTKCKGEFFSKPSNFLPECRFPEAANHGQTLAHCETSSTFRRMRKQDHTHKDSPFSPVASLARVENTPLGLEAAITNNVDPFVVCGNFSKSIFSQRNPSRRLMKVSFRTLFVFLYLFSNCVIYRFSTIFFKKFFISCRTKIIFKNLTLTLQ